jgi:predicted amidohydrolase YtcJ
VTGLALFGLVDGPSTERDLLDGLDEIRGVGGEDVPLGVAASRARADSFWRIPGIKVFADGVPPARSAWTSSCYPDGSHGRLLVEPGLEEGDALAGLTRMIGAVHRGGFQLGVHATGDRSIDAVAAALAQFPVDGVRAARHYIIHGDLISVDGIRAAARLGLGYNAQPLISKVTHGALGAAVGQSVAAEAWPLKALTNAGVSVALSSDAPIVPPTWLDALAAADELLGEAIDPAARAEALLRSMTVEAARQDHAEHVKGRLQPGYLADVTVLSEDPVAVGAAAFPRLQVTHTLSGGRLVHSPLEPALP